MKILKRLQNLEIRMNSTTFGCCLLYLYLASPFYMLALSFVLFRMGIPEGGRVGVLFIMLIGYFVICMLRKKLLVPDFWALFFAICLFLGFTLILHPEYYHWYARPEYGVLDYVLSPDSGLFIYLFIRMVNDPKKIIKTIKNASWPVYLLSAYQTLEAMRRGYWIDTSNRGYEIHMTYNLSLGYNILIFTLVFLYCAFKSGKISDWFGAGVGIGLTLVAGSRGPFLCVGIFVVLYYLRKIARSRRRMVIIGLLTMAAVALWLSYPFILRKLTGFMASHGMSSRFLTKLTQGDLTDDAGRAQIWSAAVKMIKENPWGYGAMGSRHVISQYIFVAHPHQFFLEVLIDFGVIIGGALIVFVLVSSARLLFMKDLEAWGDLYTIFFARACQLLVSMTFWHGIGLWSCLAIAKCIRMARKKKARLGPLGAFIP